MDLFKNQYHYIIAGLPDLILDQNKVPYPVSEFRKNLKGSLSKKDFDVVRSYFWRFDHTNIINKLVEPEEAEIDEKGNLAEEEIERIVSDIKEGTEIPTELAPGYLTGFIEEYINDKTETGVPEMEKWLDEGYYRYATNSKNTFAGSFYSFEKKLKNIFAAHKLIKHQLPVEDKLVGQDETTASLQRKSNYKELGIPSDFPQQELIIKALHEDNILEQEKLLDKIIWTYMDEEVFFHFFTIEKIFAHVVKLNIIERWTKLDPETGRELLEEYVKSIESSYEFPKEFA